RDDLQHRLKALLAASGQLFSSPQLDDVVPAIVDLAAALIHADACALWRFEGGSSSWRVAGSFGLSDEFRERIVDASRTPAAAAIATAELYDDQRRHREAAERANDQAAFLAEASVVLAGSLDYEQNLRTIAHLAVPRIADFCAIEITADGGERARRIVAHADPARVEAVRAFLEQYVVGSGQPNVIEQVVGTGAPSMIPSITDDMLAAIAPDPD